MAYYFTTVSRKPIHAAEGAGKILADIVFETEKKTFRVLHSIMDGLEALGVTKRDASLLTELGSIVHTSTPQGIDLGKPDWANDEIKLWATARQ